MQLIEIEPHFWELYEDCENIYLNVLINMSAISWEKTICLDEQTIQQYQTQGKGFIDGLAKSGRRRIQVEHVFGRMKCFKILSCVSFVA